VPAPLGGAASTPTTASPPPAPTNISGAAASAIVATPVGAATRSDGRRRCGGYTRHHTAGLSGPILTAPTRTTRPTPRGEQALTLALGSAELTFDPALVRDANSSFLTRQLFRGLVRLDDDLNAVPDLAERIAISDDGLTYTFTLRANAVFHDGKAIDATGR
jgi:ABC-type transport system substrate-binding protein